MALFDRASLVQIPSGYKEGKLYNIKPFDQPFEFERGSVATRINENGLIEYSGLKDENQKVQNNSFDTSTNWALDSGWSIDTETGKLVAVNGGNFTTQSNVFEDGKTYYVEYEITDYVSGSIKILAGANFNLLSHSSNGIKKQVFTTPSSGGNGLLYWRGSGTFNGSISYVKVIEIDLNTPRIDYTNGKSLLLEPQRTNRITNSEGLNVFDSDFTASDSELGIKQFEMTDNDISNWIRYEQTLVNTGSGDFTFSFLLKKKDVQDNALAGFRLTPDGLGQKYGMIDAYSGAFSPTNDAELSVTVESFNDDWWKVTGTRDGNNVNVGIGLWPALGKTLGQLDVQATGSNTFAMVQAEEGSYATSYIPTNGQAETRLEDICSGGLTNNTGNYWTVFIDYANFKSGGINGDDSIRFFDSNGVGIFNLWGLGNGFTIRSFSGDSNGNYYIYNQFGLNAKAAIRYNGSEIGLFINGVKQTITSPSPSETNWAQIYEIEQLKASDNRYELRNMTIFPEALTDTELQQLTSNT
jgi:hypothetical protein